MDTVEERVAYLDGRVEEHSQMVNGIREALASLESRVEKRFEQVDKRFEQVDRRFEQVDQRFLHLEERMDRRFEQVGLRLESIDAKMSRQFVWLAGMLVTTLIAMLGTLGAVIAATSGK